VAEAIAAAARAAAAVAAGGSGDVGGGGSGSGMLVAGEAAVAMLAVVAGAAAAAAAWAGGRGSVAAATAAAAAAAAAAAGDSGDIGGSGIGSGDDGGKGSGSGNIGSSGRGGGNVSGCGSFSSDVGHGGGSGGGGGGSGSVGGRSLPLQLALRVCCLDVALAAQLCSLCPRGSRYTLVAWASSSRLGFAHTQQSNSIAVAAKGASAALPPICPSGSGSRKQWCQQRSNSHLAGGVCEKVPWAQPAGDCGRRQMAPPTHWVFVHYWCRGGGGGWCGGGDITHIVRHRSITVDLRRNSK
jgi:hypothetical protein